MDHANASDSEKVTQPATSVRRIKCTVSLERFVKPCSALSEILSERKPGIQMVDWFDFTTGKPTRSFVVAYSGQHQKKGMVMNCCPMCGERIDAPLLERKKDDAPTSLPNSTVA